VISTDVHVVILVIAVGRVVPLMYTLHVKDLFAGLIYSNGDCFMKICVCLTGVN